MGIKIIALSIGFLGCMFISYLKYTFIQGFVQKEKQAIVYSYPLIMTKQLCIK